MLLSTAWTLRCFISFNLLNFFPFQPIQSICCCYLMLLLLFHWEEDHCKENGRCEHGTGGNVIRWSGWYEPGVLCVSERPDGDRVLSSDRWVAQSVMTHSEREDSIHIRNGKVSGKCSISNWSKCGTNMRIKHGELKLNIFALVWLPWAFFQFFNINLIMLFNIYWL